MEQHQTKGKVTNSTSLTAIFLMVFSGALLLFMIGVYVILGFHSENIVTYLKEHTSIVFELKDEVDDANSLMDMLRKDARLRSESIHYVPAKEGLSFMQKEMGADLLPEGMENPFNDLITSYVKVAYANETEMEQLRAEWSKDTKVQGVYFQNDYLSFWDIWKGRIFKFTFGAAIILLIITVMLIFNTVKLTVIMKQKSIEILELVGASWDFIRAPFLRVAIKMGLVSALLASIFLALILSFFVWSNPFLADYFSWYYMLATIAILILFGIALQWLSTRIVLNRMLKDTVDHLK